MAIQRVTKQTVKVLSGLLEAKEPIWGFEIVRRTGLMSGTVYPILDRLEDIDWVLSSWEENNERSGPRRRNYVLTSQGLEGASKLVGVAKVEQQLKGTTKLVIRGNEI